MRKQIKYSAERKFSILFIIVFIGCSFLIGPLLLNLVLNFDSLESKEKFIIILCIPWLGLVAWVTLRLRKKEQDRKLFYKKIQTNGIKTIGKVVDVRIDEIETESNDSTERSTLEYYAKVEYFNNFHNKTVQIWTPELTGIPEIGEECQIFYDEQGNFYTKFR